MNLLMIISLLFDGSAPDRELIDRQFLILFPAGSSHIPVSGVKSATSWDKVIAATLVSYDKRVACGVPRPVNNLFWDEI